MNASSESHDAVSPPATEAGLDEQQLAGSQTATLGNRLLLSINSIWASITGSFSRLMTRICQSALVVGIVTAFRNSSPAKRTIVGLLLLLLLLIIFALMMPKSASTTDSERQVITHWLDAQVAGGEGREFMSPDPDAAHIHFHRLKSYRILSRQRSGDFLVELASEMPDGSITNLEYRITVVTTPDTAGGRTIKIYHVDRVSHD